MPAFARVYAIQIELSQHAGILVVPECVMGGPSL